VEMLLGPGVNVEIKINEMRGNRLPVIVMYEPVESIVLE
jgi:hypothetical protein